MAIILYKPLHNHFYQQMNNYYYNYWLKHAPLIRGNTISYRPVALSM